MKKTMILVGLALLNLTMTPALAETATRCGQTEQRCAVKAEAAKKPATAAAKQSAASAAVKKPATSAATKQSAASAAVKQPAAAAKQSSAAANRSGKGPKVGEVPSGGRALNVVEARKLAKPATGRAYRVVEDRVVLVDAGSKKVLQVLGLASDILR
ncbi:MAG: hypothetical protein QM682_04255 [Paracoccus sp. (in: a-proteobacteria)]|uniref:hypothetical protein n=1 Tax=Paracoccus sp. TaxID=267 RepID=UPI0039E409A4